MVKRSSVARSQPDDPNIINKSTPLREWKVINDKMLMEQRSLLQRLLVTLPSYRPAERGRTCSTLLTAAIAGEKNVQFVLKDILSDEGYADFIQIENNINDVIERSVGER